MRSVKDFFTTIGLFALILGCWWLIASHGINHSNELYYNNKCIIVKVGQEDGFDNGKFHTPTVNRILLLKNIKDTTLFMEYRVHPQKYYNSHVGDTLFWKTVRKDRWFKITR